MCVCVLEQQKFDVQSVICPGCLSLGILPSLEMHPMCICVYLNSWDSQIQAHAHSEKGGAHDEDSDFIIRARV